LPKQASHGLGLLFVPAKAERNSVEVSSVNFAADVHGNICTRIVAPEGLLTISANMILSDPGTPDIVEPDAPQHPVEDLPEDALVFLLGSRYSETDRLSDIAWSLFGTVPPGWGRVQAIVDFVHEHVTFGYEHARPTKTAWDTYSEQAGVCRDFTHLASHFAGA
jgi:transglutaminase-like putative cysteine protease